jgi:hypothetical protein
MNAQKLIAVTVIAAPLLGGVALPAAAQSISLTDSWSVGTVTVTSGNGPSHITNNSTYDSNTNSWVQGISNPYTQTLSLGHPVTDPLFSVTPNNSGAADISINFTLSDDGGVHNTAFTDYIDYYANAPSDFDDMQWGTTAFTTPEGVTAGNSSSLVQSITLFDGVVAQITLPWETDWNMAQYVTFDYTGVTQHQTVPEPASLVLFASGLLGLPVVRRRLRRKTGHAA